MPEYFWVVGSGKKEENMSSFLPCCTVNRTVSGKEDPDRKKNTFEYLGYQLI